MNLSPTLFKTEFGIYSIINSKLYQGDKFDQLEMEASSGCFNSKFYLGTFSGKLLILNSTSKRVEKSVDAHSGCITNCLPFNDCILTSAEDGMIKLWSLNGSLRATVAKSNLPILSMSLLGSNEVVFACCDKLIISDIYAGTKKTISMNFIISAICTIENKSTIIVGGYNGELRIYVDYKLKSETSLGSKLFSLQCNSHLNLIYCGLKSKLKILNLNTSTVVTWFNVQGILSALYPLDNGQIHYVSSTSHGVFSYHPDIFKHGYHVSFTARNNQVVIVDVLRKSIHSLDIIVAIHKIIIASKTVFVLTKNKLYLYNNNHEQVLDVSFDIKDLYCQSKTFILLDDSNKCHCFLLINGKYLGNVPPFAICTSNSKSLAIVQNGSNDIVLYDLNALKLTNRYVHTNTVEIISMQLNEDDLLLYLDKQLDFYLLDLKQQQHPAQLIHKQVNCYQWGQHNIYCYTVGSTLTYQLMPSIDYKMAENTQIRVNYLMNISKIIEFETVCSLEMENGDIKQAAHIKPYMVHFLETLQKNVKDGFKIAMAINKEYLYACCLVVALEQNEYEMVLQCCNMLKMVAQSWCLLTMNKQFAMDLLKNKLNTATLLATNEMEYYQKELEAFHFAQMLPLAKTSLQHESLFAHYRRGYLQHIGKEEFIEEYKSLDIKVPIKDIIK